MKIVCDIDGILADSQASADKYLNIEKPDWDTWYGITDKIPPIELMCKAMRSLCFTDWVTFVTGRMNKNRYRTSKFLRNHIGRHYHYTLVMRKNGDFTEASKFKLDICNRIKPDLVIEDEPDTVKKLTEAGYKVLQLYGYRDSNQHSDHQKVGKQYVPRGVTCHYERIENRWYVVWDGDFHSSDSGRLQCDNHDSMMLEMGWQVGKAK